MAAKGAPTVRKLGAERCPRKRFCLQMYLRLAGSEQFVDRVVFRGVDSIPSVAHLKAGRFGPARLAAAHPVGGPVQNHIDRCWWMAQYLA